MAAENEGNSLSIGIVGGTADGQKILEILNNIPTINLAYLADDNNDSPGFRTARSKGVRTIGDVREALERIPTNLIIDATSSPEDAAIIREAASADAKVLPVTAALLLFDVFNDSRLKVNQEVSSDIRGIQEGIAKNTKNVEKALQGIDKVAADLEVLAVNAGIQAARAAQYGVGFAVVAGEVKSTARIAKDLAQDIERVNEEIMSMSDKIDLSLAKLK